MAASTTLPGTPSKSALSPGKLGDLSAVRELIDANRRRWKMLLVVRALAFAVAVPLAYFWVAVLFDEAAHLGTVGRVLACAGFLAAVTWGARFLIQGRSEIQLSDDQVALAMERRTRGGVTNRLINALQLARLGKTEMTEAVLDENIEALGRIRLEVAAQSSAAWQALATAGVLVGLGVGLWLWHQDGFLTSAARILMPLAQIEPIYRTTLIVEPGDIEANGDVPLRITVQGERPTSLVVTRSSMGKRERETIPMGTDDEAITHLLKGITHDTDYFVRANDFTSPIFRITVPRRAALTRLRVTYHYPAYTGLADKTVDIPSGELEAVHGTKAHLAFAFDGADRARLLLDRPNGARGMLDLPLIASANGFEGDLVLDDLLGYAVEVATPGKPPQRIGPFAIRVVRDQEPTLELAGIERARELTLDAELPLRISAQDDFGLETVGVFYRMVTIGESVFSEDAWRELKTWPGNRQGRLRAEHHVKLSSLPVAEGDRIELAVRAKDTFPGRKGWTVGPTFDLVLGGDGAGLQLLYEQILRADKDLADLARRQDDLARSISAWQRKLEGDGDLRWDDPKNVEQLHAALKQQKTSQSTLQGDAGRIARSMPALANNLRLGVGMLADTEMVRVQRILDSVPTRDTPGAKQAALADAKITLERIGRSLHDIREQYASFRQEWERNQMTAFAKLLADRQQKLREQSANPSSLAGTTQAHRQRKVLEVVNLVRPAFADLSDRLKDEVPELASAYRQGAEVFAAEPLKNAIHQAASHLDASRWTDAVTSQAKAAELLQDVYQRLRKAQVEAARKALAALKERARSDPKAKADIDDLPPGIAEALVKYFPDDLKLEDSARLEEVIQAAKKNATAGTTGQKSPPMFYDVDPKQLDLEKDSGVRQDTSTLRLGNTSEKTNELVLPKADAFNKVQPFIQDKFDDLVGKLLDEADELDKQYQTLKLSTNQNNNDPGEINKQGGTINSTGAVAATGNKKPPTTEGGGVARTGRQGARAFGMVADKVAPDMRGRDKALDGMQEAPDQKGTMKLQKTPDPQQDFSTGVGGKKVESDDTHFSLHDAGKWKDDMAKRMDKAQKKQYIVERQGEKLDPKIAAQLRDLTSQQEQVIERLKAIKKELKNLYLPTDHLDDLSASLRANLDRLKEQPDAEMFRLQLQTLDRLRGAAKVFRAANSNFQPSVPRDRRVQGRVLDGPPAPPLPGYEEALKSYYLRLADHP